MEKTIGGNNKKSILIGASGVIGSTLYSHLNKLGNRVVGTKNSATGCPALVTLDLRENDLSSFVKNIRSEDTVYLLAAYSNPAWIHDNASEAMALNSIGTKRLIKELLPVEPHLIFMSSVEVFDGTKGAYNEGDKPNPLNLYGHLKFEIEEYLELHYPRSTIVRTGWNVGNRPKSRCVVSLTYKTLLGLDARMAEDNSFSIIDAADTAVGLARLEGADDVRKIHFAGDSPIRRTQLADLVKKFSSRGSEMSYSKCRFSEINYSEPRGRLNDLDNSMSKERFNMTYREIDEIIRAKVAILDNI